MSTKRLIRLEIKDITIEGSFEGMLSPYGGTPDSYGDVIEPGAYTKTIKDHGNKVPLLWQHKTDVPIGELTLEDRPDGLWCRGQLLLASGAAKEAYLFIKARIVKGLSIGFETIKDSVEGGIRHLKEIRLYEGSIVTFPANMAALIESVKAAMLEKKDDFNSELADIQLEDAGYQMMCALRYALFDTIYSQLSRDEKISTAELVIQQFADAFMAYLPPYLDMMNEMYVGGGMEMMAARRRLELKAGATFSASNKSTIQSHMHGVKDAADAVLALLEGDAGTAKAAATPPREAADPKTEPAPDHSAIAVQLTELKGALSWSN